MISNKSNCSDMGHYGTPEPKRNTSRQLFCKTGQPKEPPSIMLNTVGVDETKKRTTYQSVDVQYTGNWHSHICQGYSKIHFSDIPPFKVFIIVRYICWKTKSCKLSYLGVSATYFFSILQNFQILRKFVECSPNTFTSTQLFSICTINNETCR